MDSSVHLTAEQQEKIDQYSDFTNCNNPDAAYNCLMSTGWDVQQAVEKFLTENFGNVVVEPYCPKEPSSAQWSRLADLGASNNQPVDEIGYINHHEMESTARLHQTVMPLIPKDCASISEALKYFIANFQMNYSPLSDIPRPTFHSETLEDAVKLAFHQNDENQRLPLIFFITHQQSGNSRKFIENVMCNEIICGLLEDMCILFGWDVTEKENKEKLSNLLESSRMREMIEYMDYIFKFSIDSFPVLVAISTSLKIISKSTSSDTTEEVYNKLETAFEVFERDLIIECKKRMEREENQKIIKKQNEAYEKGLIADVLQKSKMDCQPFKTPTQAESEHVVEGHVKKTDRIDENLKAKTITAIALPDSKLPNEPDEFAADAISIKFRLPENVQVTRRFYRSDSINTIFDFLATMRFTMANSRVFNSDIPKKEVSSVYNVRETFAEVDWPNRTVIMVEYTRD